jgi:hypothetical protein
MGILLSYAPRCYIFPDYNILIIITLDTDDSTTKLVNDLPSKVLHISVK